MVIRIAFAMLLSLVAMALPAGAMTLTYTQRGAGAADTGWTNTFNLDGPSGGMYVAVVDIDLRIRRRACGSSNNCAASGFAAAYLYDGTIVSNPAVNHWCSDGKAGGYCKETSTGYLTLSDGPLILYWGLYLSVWPEGYKLPWKVKVTLSIPDEFAITPLPAALPLLASGLGMLALVRFRKSRQPRTKTAPGYLQFSASY